MYVRSHIVMMMSEEGTLDANRLSSLIVHCLDGTSVRVFLDSKSWSTKRFCKLENIKNFIITLMGRRE